VAVASAGQYANNLHLAPDRQITTATPHHSIFTSRMLFLTPNRVTALKARIEISLSYNIFGISHI